MTRVTRHSPTPSGGAAYAPCVTSVDAPPGRTPARVCVTLRSGRVHVEAGAEAIRVKGASFSTEPDGGVLVNAGAGAVSISCPDGTDIVIGSHAARVTTDGKLGSVRISVTSGRVEVAEARELDVRTASGRVSVGRVEGALRCTATSGRVEVDHAGSVDISVKSGRIEVGDTGDARVHALSGRVEVGAGAGSTVEVKVTSGRVSVTLPRGCCPATNLSTRRGRIDNEIPTGSDGRVDVQTVAGRVSLAWR